MEVKIYRPVVDSGLMNCEFFIKLMKTYLLASINLTLYVPCIILQCVDEPTRCTILINSFSFHRFFLALHVSNEFTRSTHVEQEKTVE